MILIFYKSTCPTFAQQSALMLIAHRGGVVDSTLTENGLAALEKAQQLDYQMIETDVRVTKDGMLIAQHDADFRRYYDVNRKVTDMQWSEVAKLKSTLDGNVPLRLEEVMQLCKKGKMSLMLDIKISGMDSAMFEKLISLLDRYDLRKSALAIGTDESTEYLTGKIRLSCSRSQLEENMKKTGYRASDFYLFERASNLKREDVKWAKDKGIMTVAAINKFHYRNSADVFRAAQKDCENLRSYGVTNFQIDSEYRRFLIN